MGSTKHLFFLKKFIKTEAKHLHTRKSIEYVSVAYSPCAYNNTLLNFLTLRKLNLLSTAIAYKNRFIGLQSTVSSRMAGMFTLDGNKMRATKTFNLYYLYFLRAYNKVNVPSDFLTSMNFQKYDFSEFKSLYDSYELFKDVNRAFLWRIEQNLPMVKPICKNVKTKKQKKSKLRKKYSVEYRYVLPAQRSAVCIRWLSLLVKIENLHILNSYGTILTSFLIEPESSKFAMLKSKTYAGLIDKQ